MSNIRARYVGHPDGADLNAVPVGSEWNVRHVHVPYGELLPAEIDGGPVLASFVESLLEQADNWERADGDDAAARAREAEERAAREAVEAEQALADEAEQPDAESSDVTITTPAAAGGTKGA